MNMTFVHLQVQSAFSLLNSAVTIERLVDQADKNGFKAVALTDENVMYGAITFYQKCLERGLKPVIGLTASVLADDQNPAGEAYPLVLLAKNEQGYRNLLKLSSAAKTTEFSGVKKSWLVNYRSGLIAITPGKSGEIEQFLFSGEKKKAEKALLYFTETFGREHFYLSVQRHGAAEDDLNERLLSFANEHDVPLVATNDVRYLGREDHMAYDCLTAIGEGKTIDDSERKRLETTEHFLKSSAEMMDLFHDLPEAINNTVRIMNECNVTLDLGRTLLPKYSTPNGESADDYLEMLCQKGLEAKVANVTQAYSERLSYELSVITNMRFSDYFLIVWDFMDYAHRQQIITGPGRGSAAGSLVAYVLNITNVDPIEHELLFERFLNPERVTMPDIDIDFPDNRRDEMIQYVAGKYGKHHVAQIITFGTLAAKAAVRDVGKAMGIEGAEVNQLSKLIPNRVGTTLKSAYRDVPALQQFLAQSEARKKWYETALSIEGLPRHTSTHAAGVIISDRPLTDHTPVEDGHDDVYLTQFAMGSLESIGLLKMDFLGLRNLTIIQDILKGVKHETGRDLILDDIPLDDAQTYRLLTKGDTTGVFQLESEGMRNVLKRLKPTSLEDIVAVNALYRPGPMENIPVYIQRKHSGEAVEYPHPDLKKILDKTYGVIVYQEQIMQIASLMAGFTLGEADLLRRAVSKKNRQTLQEQRTHFVEGSLQKGYSEQTANDIYDLIVRFADYGFNRSHAVAYSMIAYQLAYLKANYPQHFFSALLTSAIGNEDKLSQYIYEAKQRDIRILPPSINQSRFNFYAENQSLRYSLAAIKHVGGTVLKEIFQERRKRPFQDLFDFCMRVSLKIVNRRVIESLILAGCFDEFGEERATLLASIDVAIEHAGLVSDDLFFDEELNLKPKYVSVEPMTQQQKLEQEKETLGFYLSSHPVSLYKEVFQDQETTPIYELLLAPSGTTLSVGVMVTNDRVIRTKKGEEMAFLTLTDETGELEGVVFPRVYRKYAELIQKGRVLLIAGKIEERDDKRQLVIQHLEAAESLSPTDLLYLKITDEQKKQGILRDVQHHLVASQGSTPVMVYYESEKKLVQLPRDYRVEVNDELMTLLKNQLGSDHVAIKKL